MKRFIIFLILICLIGFLYFKFFLSKRQNLEYILKDVEDISFDIEDYKIFGTHFNISACIDESLSDKLELVLKNNNEEISIDANFKYEDNKTCVYLSDKNNEGLLLDDLNLGKYILLVKSNLEEVKYYTFNNKTKYGALEYYSITNNESNKKINIDFENYKNINYVKFMIGKSILPDDVYDITIDAGHGGVDIGASGNLDGEVYNESDITLKISKELKENLTDLGLKVKLTREDDSYLEPYGDTGRAVIPNKYKSKYSISIHLNSFEGKMNYGGVEVYTANDINYDLSKLFADNISDIVGYSKKQTDKIDNGIYFTYFKEENIKNSNDEMIKKGFRTYDIKLGAPYMYMIREVGGKSTYAYVDGRNKKNGLNEFYNSNQTAEPYLLELGYINYKNDLDKFINDSDTFANAISEALKTYLNISQK
ncbi:MAG: N-acetylmuramoyl-L-alanine amidase [bacterium]|nr:N-acetylmuramoyl-L-alanine amidase [bacterium]